MNPEVHRPIFIMGSPRSGTGILYRTMARHPDLAWSENLLADSAVGLENRNFKWQENLSPAEKETQAMLLDELLARLGYHD